MIYQTRYLPIARYCLPVTLFTWNELHEIQKLFIYLLLLKLGLNCHSPREAIYGPTSWGGRGLLDLRLEQPILHINTTIGHMRNKDGAEKSIIVNLHGHQIVSGLSKPFFNMTQINYHTSPRIPDGIMCGI